MDVEKYLQKYRAGYDDIKNNWTFIKSGVFVSSLVADLWFESMNLDMNPIRDVARC